jgi:hypothetical protein
VALVLVILGLIFWLALGWTVLGIVLLVVGLILLLVTPAPYGGAGYWRRGP